jgi:hypothetical protein
MAETKTFQERLKEYEEILNKYTEGFGLQYILYNPEVVPILNLVYDQIQNLDSDG